MVSVIKDLSYFIENTDGVFAQPGRRGSVGRRRKA